ncbi:Major Facilitator Superfamily (MFS) [Thraustotheca clavata]|uniref:Lysosomal dipeptide transporter MFSD1 n=1 Tax=Thraustotheca clavata TaxID=74557 RepID=A0A1W0A4F6_9STRA|nr:Major Facilitator Superfamily (MFS) [Thraustotheca clavata]
MYHLRRFTMVNKSNLRMRWLVLVLSCTLMIGNYYCFDNPAALKSQLQQHFSDGKIPAEHFEFLFNMLYTLYSIPNIVLPFFGGFLVDRLGARLCLMIFALAITLGQIVFAFGCSVSQFNVMLLGRVLFGLGGESLGVAQSTLVASWFKNKELALALGINLSIARLGSVFNNELSPVIAAHYNVSSALWMGVVMCGVSLIATLIVIPIDKRAEAAIARSKSFAASKASASSNFSFRDFREFRPIFWLLAIACMVVYGCVIPFNNVASSLLMERDFFREPPLLCRQCGAGVYADKINCTTISSGCPPVPPYSWPLPALSQNCTIKKPEDQLHCSHTPPFVLESMINCDDEAWKKGPFSAIYCEKKSQAAAAAATPMSVPYLISAILSPFMGYAVDRIGFRAGLALVASLLLTIVHLLLGSTHITYWVPLVLQGIAYCVFAAALWPSIPCKCSCSKNLISSLDVVDARMIGSAYGAITSIQNLGLALFPMLVATVYSIDKVYIPNVEMLFVAFGALGSLAAIALNIRRSNALSNEKTQIKRLICNLIRCFSNHFIFDMESLQLVVLVLTGALNIGNSYCYDNPSALKSQLQEHFHEMGSHEYEMAFNLLYTVYSIPNIILPFFGGYLTDRFGPRKVLFVMTLFITIGQMIVAWGSQCNSFLIMMFGRVVFGLGGETISVAQATLLAMWFPSYELAFANGVLLCISKLAATLNNEMSPFFAENFGLVNALWFGAVLCGLSLFATLILARIDAKAEEHIDYDVLSQDEREREHQFKEHILPSDAAQFSMSFWLIAILYFTIYAIVGPFNNVASSVFMERDYYKTLPEECIRCGTGFYASDPNCTLPNANCPSSPSYQYPLPHLSSSCIDHIKSGNDQITCSTTPPYLTTQDINCDKKEWKTGTLTKAYCNTKYKAEQSAAIPLGTASFVIAISAPLCGYLVDHFGCRALIAVAMAMRHKTTVLNRNDKRLSLQENEDQFTFLQALRHCPPSRHYLSLHLRAMSRLSESREHTPSQEGLDEIDLKTFDRNSMICKAVLILWNNSQRMRSWRKWVEIVAIENKRIHLQYVHQVRKSTLSLLKRGPPYTNDEVITLEEWALKIQTKIFQNIAPNLIRDVILHMKLSHYRAHDCLFVQGDIGNGYYILFSGTISIYVDMPQDSITKLYYGRAATLEEIQLNPALLGEYRYDIFEGDGFGEVAMFSSDGRRTASALASTKCEVIEIPKEVYCRTLKKSQYEALNKAQMLAFLPTVDIFTDWVHSKLLLLINLLERRELPFGYELHVADKPMAVVYFILSGEVQLTQMWQSEATSLNPLKPKAHTTLPITVDTITRRGIIGIQSLVEPGVKSKYSALAVTESIDCYALGQHHLDAFRALLQNANLVHLRNTWHTLEQARQSRYDQAVKALKLTPQPTSPIPIQPQTKLRYHRDRVLPFIPQMTSMAGKKFVFTDFDLLTRQDQDQICLAPTSLPKMTIPIKPQIPKDEQDRVVAQHFAALKAQSWDPHQGFLPSTDIAKDKTNYDKVNSIRPERPTLPPFERDLAHSRFKARAVLKQHQTFKARRIAPEQIVSYKHSF